MKVNERKMLRHLLLAVLAAVMLMGTSALAASFVTMSYEPSYGGYVGLYNAKYDTDLYFVLKAPGSGLIDVTGLCRSSYGYNYGCSVTMYNVNGYLIDYNSSNYVNEESGSYVRYAITPSTYYFHVEADEGYKYGLGIKYKARAKNYGGASKAKSVTLSRGKALTGVVSAYSYKQQKWFKFYVPQQSRTVKLKMVVNGGQGQTIAYVAGPGLKKTERFYFYPTKTKGSSWTLSLYTRVTNRYGSYNTGPRAGWYYVLFTKNANSSSYKRSNGEFAVKWTY